MRKTSRLELTVFAQAWRDTLDHYPDIVIADQIRIASQILWLEVDEAGTAIKPVTDLKMTASQASNIKMGKTDVQGRTLEGLILGLYSYSQEAGKDAFGFYLDRLAALLKQRGQDVVSGTVSPERQEIFLNIILKKKGKDQGFSLDLIERAAATLQGLPAAQRAFSFTVSDLLESEFVARGLRPDHPEDRQRFVAACQALGMRISIEDVDVALRGDCVSEILLGKLRNVMIKDRATGQLWSFEELKEIRDATLLPT